MIVKLLIEHHLGFLSLTGGCRGLFESTLVKMSNCWKSHALALNNEKLERTQSNAQQNKDKHRTPATNVKYTNQQINRSEPSDDKR